MRVLTFVSLLFALLATVAHLTAQEALTTASIAGHVVDQTGAVLADATVKAQQTNTSQSYTAQTDREGRFRLSYLPVGAYAISAEAKGFKNGTRTAELTVGAAFDLTLTLSITGATSSVEVHSAAPIIETDRSQIGETVDHTETANLPFEGRNYLDMALLVPGVSPTNTNSTQTLAETAEVVGQGYSINSQRNFSNSFVVDGVSGNDDAAGVAGNAFGMEAINEFQVVTAGGQAEFGRAMGGYFNLVTKSGSNDLRGAAYGFLRNQRMNANNALAASKLPLTQSLFGATLSGPIRRSHAFFFGNYEGQRLNTRGIITIAPANAAQINARLTAVGYHAPLLPLGTGPTSQYPTTLHTDNGFLRVDHRFSSRDQLNARYSYYGLTSINARGTGGLNAVSNGTSVYDTNHTIAVGNIFAISPRTYNETRAQFVYDSLNAPPNDQIGPAVTISGVAVLGRSTSSPTARLNYLYEVVDNLVLERGSHTMKAGADVLYNNDTITYPQSLYGSYSFSSMATFLAGAYNSQGFTQNFGTPTVQQNNPNVGFYAQDEWKISRSLTMNTGVRYDLDFLQTINTAIGDISPRFGFAWTPFAGRKTVVRGSLGVYFDRIPLRPLANALLSAHNTTDYARATLLSYTFSPGQTGAPTFPAIATAPPAEALENFSLMNPSIRTPFSQQVSLGIEQQFAANSKLGVSYQHLRGEHLIGAINTNINIDGTRPDPTRGNIKPYSSAFDSYFDGMEVSFEQRPTTWASARVSYTWSKAIDDIGEFFFSAPINNFNPGEDRSRADDDQRHRVVFDATVYSSKKPATSLVDHLTHGWRLGGILQYYSALPFNITTGANTKQATSQRPCAEGYTLSGTNPCTEGLFGAVIGRNAGKGFDYFSLNSRLSRTFALTERVRLEGMAEAFNALNHRNNMVPNGTWGTGIYPSTPNSTFGQATAVGDPRSIQLAARVTF